MKELISYRLRKPSLVFVFFFLFSSLKVMAQTEKILPLGNSITWGKSDAAEPAVGEHGYRDHLFNKLAGYNVEFTGPRMGDWGAQFLGDPNFPSTPDDPYFGYYVDGARIEQFLPDSGAYDVKQMLDDLNANDLPHYVLLHIGTNDISTYQEVGSYDKSGTMMYELKVLMDALLGYNNGGHVIEQIFLCQIIPIAPYNQFPKKNNKIIEYNSQIYKMWLDLENDKNRVTIVNMYNPFLINQSTYYNTIYDNYHPNTNGYEAMADIFADYVKDYLGKFIVDEFDRIGAQPDSLLNGTNGWSASDSIKIHNVGESGGGAIYSDALKPSWTHLAIWDSSKGLNTVSMKIDTNSTDNAALLDGVGLLVGMNSTDVTSANGYMVFVRKSKVRLYNMVGGKTGTELDNLSVGNYVPGDVLRVTYMIGDDQNRFFVNYNGQDLSPPLKDDRAVRESEENFYSGVMFRGSTGDAKTEPSALIDYFKAESKVRDIVPPAQITTLNVIATTNSSISLEWQAVGGDGNKGTAGGYDLRYATVPLDEDNFEYGFIVGNVPVPKAAGEWENVTVCGLLSGVKYYLAVRAVDGWGNQGTLSESKSGKTMSIGVIADNFGQATLGENWVCDSTEYRINPAYDEMMNVLDGDWGSMAIFTGRVNPTTVEMVWGHAATTQGGPSIDNGGLILMADDTTLNANGYFIFVRTKIQNKQIYLFDIRDGKLDSLLDATPYDLKNIPDANDTLTVVIDKSETSYNRFVVYVNSRSASRFGLYDTRGESYRHGRQEKNYCGLLLARLESERNNDVAAFITTGEKGCASDIVVIKRPVSQGIVNQELLDFQGVTDSLIIEVQDENSIPVDGAPLFFHMISGGDMSTPQPPVGDILIEAECGVLETPMIEAEDSEASGSRCIFSIERGARLGSAMYQFYVPTAGTYYFWARAWATENNFVLFFELEGKTQSEGFTWHVFENERGLQGFWKWDQIHDLESALPFSANLDKGFYTMRFYTGHDRVQLDKILITTKDPPSESELADMTTLETLVTGVDGQASAAWTLGKIADDPTTVDVNEGLNMIVVSTLGAIDTVEFRSYGLPADPDSIEKVNDNQLGKGGQQLGLPFVAIIEDAYGNRKPGVDVQFEIIQGRGASLTNASGTSDANGEVSTLLTLGKQDSVQQVKVTFSGYTGPDVVFKASADSGLVNRIESEVVKEKHYIGDVLPDYIKVTVRDDQWIPVENVNVVFEVIEGDASVGKKQPKQTKTEGLVQDTLILGQTAGVVKVIARIEGTQIQSVVLVDSVYYKGVEIEKIPEGNGQIANVNEQTPKPLTVIVFNSLGQGQKDHPVIFETKGQGFHFPDLSTKIELKTDNFGKASTHVVAGSKQGVYQNIVWVTATDGFNNLKDSPAKFRLYARSAVSHLKKIKGDSLTGVVQEMLPVPLTVQMVDRHGNPVGGQPVDFNIEAGGGYFKGGDVNKTVISDPTEGETYVYYFLGKEVGSFNNIVKASTENPGSDKIITFFHISAKSSRADSVAAIVDTLLTGIVGKELSQPIRVKVMDIYGNLIIGEWVTFSVISGGGALNGSADTVKTLWTDSTGVASVNWTLGTQAGAQNNVLKATSFNGIDTLKGSPIHFRASADPDSVNDSRSMIEATAQVKTHKDSLCQITVILKDSYGNPVPGKQVKLVVTGGDYNYVRDPTDLTDSQGRAYGVLQSLSAGEKLIQAVVEGDTLGTEARVIFLATEAKEIKRYSGYGQTGNVGTVLKDPLVVQVTDENDNSVEYGPVYFEVVGDKGSLLEKQPVVSDSNGFAQVHLLLDSGVGDYGVHASTGDLQGNPYFQATARIGLPEFMDIADENRDVTGAAGEKLPHPFVVKVVDEDGLAVAGVEISFRLDETNGSNGAIVTSQPSITDMYGCASAYFRMDTGSGVTSYIQAANSNLSGSPIWFSAESIAGPARKIEAVSSTEQNVTVGKTVLLKTRVTDKNGNKKSGFPVQFKILEGTATILEGAVSVTNSWGEASATIALGETIGTVKVWAMCQTLEGSPVEFTIHAVSTKQAMGIVRYPPSEETITGTINHKLVDPLRVMVIDRYGNPVSGSTVFFELESGQGSLESNTGVSLPNLKVTSDDKGIAAVFFNVGPNPGETDIVKVRQEDEVVFDIKAVNNPNFPTLTKNYQSSYSVDEGDSIRLSLMAQDLDGDTLTFLIGNLFPPEGATIKKQTDITATFHWAPNYDQEGIYPIVLRVIDGRGGYDETTVTIIVENTNRFPEIVLTSPSGDTTLSAGETTVFWIDARDPDGDQLSYRWRVNKETIIGRDYPVYYHTTEESFAGKQIVDVQVYDETGFSVASFRWEITVVPWASVELLEFAAQFEAEKTQVRIWWSTSNERDNFGFDVFRSLSEEGEYVKINEELILSQDGGNYRFIDNAIQAGRTYYYKLVDTDIHGNHKEHGPRKVEVPLPRKFGLSQNYPNPFNPVTTIQYQIPKREKVVLNIYNMMGQRVATLVNGEQNPGYYAAEWDGRDESGREASTGIYIYRLRNEHQTLTRKMVKIR